jgi:hypothetical protein
MSTALHSVRHPFEASATGRAHLLRSVGLVAGAAGLALVAVALIANLVVAADGEPGRSETLAWTFGLTTTGFVALKTGIALTLIGILLRVKDRIDAVKATLPALAPASRETPTALPDTDTGYGAATRTARALGPLPIHAMAQRMWAPMVAMGSMLVVVGLVLALIQSGTDDPADFASLGAWVQGVQFLGEGLILAGISFLLGTILGELRRGGGEVQEALGVTVWTLKLPWSAKAFVGLMAVGLMAAIAQFVLYVVATSVDDPSTWFAVLGPLREVALGLLLAGIVLALFTIGTVLGFQLDRMRTLVRGEGQS